MASEISLESSAPREERHLVTARCRPEPSVLRQTRACQRPSCTRLKVVAARMLSKKDREQDDDGDWDTE